MGPVQLSELSQELKPAPARGPDRETVQGRLGSGRQNWERGTAGLAVAPEGLGAC